LYVSLEEIPKLCQIMEKNNGMEQEHLIWKQIKKFNPKATLSVKFGIYVHQMTIFKKVLDKCPNYFLVTLLSSIF
jgi:hypothetical protein